MCNPAFVQIGIMAFSAISQQQSEVAQGKYQKGVADYNARVTQNQMQEVRNEGNEAENAHRQKVLELISKQRAQLGASGIDVNSDSALQLQDDAATLGEADALRIRGNYTSKINSMATSTDLLKSQGEMALAAGRNAGNASLLKGAANIAGTGVADKWFTPNSSAKVGA